MPTSAARHELQGGLAAFLWRQWAQMGVLAAAERSDRWAADPEALLLLSFEVGREEPRLFEEVLDWLMKNERLVSVQRLRNLARDEDDRALVEAVVGWLGQRRRRSRLEARPAPTGGPAEAQPFFRHSTLPVDDPDPAFLAQGFLKPKSDPSAKSQTPNVRTPPPTAAQHGRPRGGDPNLAHHRLNQAAAALSSGGRALRTQSARLISSLAT